MKPSPDRREPVLWLKRLVILSELKSSSVIRNIEFRRGLNIIQTRQMETSGGPVAGHSVGKTLLMRLIRYTLGESQFGTEETEKNIASAFGTAYVVGHWCVMGVDWIVVRPLSQSESATSFAVHSDNWMQIVDAHEGEHPHREFVKAVNEAVLCEMPTFTLPRGREARWLDVLAWLSRDYQCGYRRANEWRHDDANSGPSLDREENSQVMQWLLGLMSQEEVDLRLKHRELLGDQAKHKRDGEREQRRLDTLRPELWNKLELDQDAEVAEEQATFNSVKPVEVVADNIRSLEALKGERLAESRIVELEDKRDAVQEKMTDAEANIRSCNSTIQFLEKQISEYERDPLKPYARCQAEPNCWMQEKAKETADDPALDDHVTDLREQHAEQRQKLEASRLEKESCEEKLREANDQLRAERSRLAGELSGIDEKIGKWKGFRGDAITYQGVAASVADANKSLNRAESNVKESLGIQDSVRSKHSQEVSSLTDVYQDTLQRIFGKEAVGRIQVDGNGLQPVPDRRLAPAGAALSVMTTVLAFDIACVAASIAGVGRHPRFLMHDSPREGDMEGPLFRRLFEIVAELEEEFTDTDQLSFQYIVSTTTAPPSELGSEDGPYVCETLDARNERGLLLKKRF